MINKNAKGSRKEVLSHRWLEGKGYVVHTTKRVPYSNNDVFGLFDHIALSGKKVMPLAVRVYERGKAYEKLESIWLQHNRTEVLAVQTKANTSPRDLVDFEPYAKNMILLWITWKDRTAEPRVYFLNPYFAKESSEKLTD